MRIAVTYEDGKVFQHFGHTERFKIYDVENNKIVMATTINTNGSSHGALPDVLKKLEVEKLICGGIGNGAQRALREVGIKVYACVKGNSDQSVNDLLCGRLAFDAEATCSHQGQHHDGANAVCGGKKHSDS
jgi:predicted Fe-Mo cluster-binding NifX family protein